MLALGGNAQLFGMEHLKIGGDWSQYKYGFAEDFEVSLTECRSGVIKFKIASESVANSFEDQDSVE